MGLKDRDYYWEHYDKVFRDRGSSTPSAEKDRDKELARIRKRPRKIVVRGVWVAWLLVVVFVAIPLAFWLLLKHGLIG